MKIRNDIRIMTRTDWLNEKKDFASKELEAVYRKVKVNKLISSCPEIQEVFYKRINQLTQLAFLDNTIIDR